MTRQAPALLVAFALVAPLAVGAQDPPVESPPPLREESSTLAPPGASSEFVWAIHRLRGRIRVGYESTGVMPGESLGLLGLHFDVFGIFEDVPELSLGAGGYAAVDGERGGFFVGGFDAGYRFPLFEDDALALELGAFLGGGGGGSAPQGSGLMLREHLALEYRPGRIGLRLEGSNVDFPDGTVGGQQIGLGVAIPFEPWYARPVPRTEDRETATWWSPAHPFRASVSFASLSPSGSLRTSGGRLRNTIGLAGIRVDGFLDPNTFFATVSAHGALRGDVSGYAQLLAGIGAQFRVAAVASLEARLLVGSGGGGRVETGGGFLVQPSIGTRATVTRGFDVFLSYGWQSAPNGEFDASVFEFGGSIETVPVRPRPGEEGKLLARGAAIEPWTFEFAARHAFVDGSTRLKSGAAQSDSQLVGFLVKRPFNPWLSGGGEAYGALGGGIGGYAEGWFGLEAHTAPFSTLDELALLATARLGAGGGGGVDSGSGLLFGYGAGARWRLTPTLAASLELGRVEAASGSFGATVAQLGLAWSFAIPTS